MNTLLLYYIISRILWIISIIELIVVKMRQNITINHIEEILYIILIILPVVGEILIFGGILLDIIALIRNIPYEKE